MKGYFRNGTIGNWKTEIHADNGNKYLMSLHSEKSPFDLPNGCRVEGEISDNETFIVKKQINYNE